MNRLFKIAAATIISAAVVTVTGCNTVKGAFVGAGQDTKATANALGLNGSNHKAHHKAAHNKSTHHKKAAHHTKKASAKSTTTTTTTTDTTAPAAAEPAATTGQTQDNTAQ